jgi:hypothetical protein
MNQIAMQIPRVKALAFPILLVLLAAVVFGALWAYMRVLERHALNNPVIRDQILADGHVRPLAEVAKTVARLQLVTTEVDTTVKTQMSNDSWRGLATATVEAPAKFLYGVDLSGVDVRSIGFSPASSSYFVKIPPPRRISTEVCGDDETIKVQVGWARLRSRAGEYYLGLARKTLYAEARKMTLSPEDAQKVRETTLAQVEQAVRRFVGASAKVEVVFDDNAPAPAPVAGAEDDPNRSSP